MFSHVPGFPGAIGQFGALTDGTLSDMEESTLAKLRWLPTAILALAALYFTLVFIYLINQDPLYRSQPFDGWSFKALAGSSCALLAVALALSLCLPRSARSNVALLVASSGAALLTFEVALTLLNFSGQQALKNDKTVSFALAAGRPVGELDPWAFIGDLRREGSDDPVLFYGASHGGIVSRPDGLRLRILSGVSRATTVLHNESGSFEPYLADEYGFNNPLGLHDSAPLDVVLIGDSFTHSPSVSRADSVAGHIRTSIPKTLNLGISGAGPLASLAALVEYASTAEPRIVVWGWFEGNDLWDLTREMRLPEFRRYLAEPTPWGLKALQREIDSVWRSRAVRDERWRHFRTPKEVLLLRSTRWFFGFQSFPDVEENPDALNNAEHVLVTARDLIRGWGGQLVLVYLPEAGNYCGLVKSWRNDCDQYGSGLSLYVAWRDEVFELFERLGVPVVDGHAVFLETGQPGDMFFHPHSHYSPEGYRVIANALLREIRPMLNRHPDRSSVAPAAPLARNHP